VKAFRNLPVDEQAEVVSLVGDIGLVNGASSVHVHAVFILADGTAVICRRLMFGRRSRFLRELDMATDLYLFQLEARG
jgi:predicted DNA-binding protein with PD1-like motif